MPQQRKDISNRPIQAKYNRFPTGKIFGIIVVLGLLVAGYFGYKRYSTVSSMSMAQLYGEASKGKPDAVLLLENKYKNMKGNQARIENIKEYISNISPDTRALAVKMFKSLDLNDERQDGLYSRIATDYIIDLMDDYKRTGNKGTGKETERSNTKKSLSEPDKVKIACLEVLPELKPHWFGKKRANDILDIAIPLLSSKNNDLILAASESLRGCTGQREFGKNYDKWLNWWNIERGKYPGFPKK